MNRTSLSPTSVALGGTAVVMACACGTAASSAKLLALGGVAATSTMIHPLFIAMAAVLIVGGLAMRRRASGAVALGGFAVLSIAATLTPPSVMSTKHLPWNATQMTGGVLYVAAAAAIVYAFWRAYPSRHPAASGTAMGGMALATGCSCCMVTGALAGMAVTLGGNGAYFESMPVFFWTGIALVTGGLLALGGARAAVLAPAGALVIRYAPELLKRTGDWMVNGVNLRFIPGYLLTVAGSGIILYGFVLAYRVAGEHAASERQPLLPEMQPDLARAGS